MPVKHKVIVTDVKPPKPPEPVYKPGVDKAADRQAYNASELSLDTFERLWGEAPF